LQAQLAFLRAVREVAGRTTDKPDPAASCSVPSSNCSFAELAPAAAPPRGGGRPDPTDAAADWPRLDGYEVLGELGRGAMGVVYKARQRGLRRLVALKMLHPGTAGSPESRRRFHSEAEKLAHLRHPNIVQVHEVGEQHGRPFFAMEFVEGCSLAQRLAGARLPDGQAAQLVETLARAIHHAHERGIIHRDLKPANVLLLGDVETAIERCAPKVADFGLAKQLDAAGQTHSGMVVGTPGYMAPEQADPRPHAAHPAVDVYGLGAILYELLTGRPPFQAATPLQVLEQVRHQEPVPPSRWNAGVPRDLETICLKCLHKEPGRRYGGADALAEDLRRFQRGEPIQARPVGLVERGWLWCRRRPVPAGLVAALVLALLGSLYLWKEAASGRRLAVAARQQAEDRVRVLLRLLTANLEISGSSFLQKRGGDSISRGLLAEAEAACLHLREQGGDGPELRRLLALVWTKEGSLLSRRWQYDKAADLLGRALDLWDRLPAEAARDRENRWGRACTLWELGRTYVGQGRRAEAVRTFEQARQLCRGLGTQGSPPEVRLVDAASGLELIYLSLDGSGGPQEARRQLERLRPTLQPLAREPLPDPNLLYLLGVCCARLAGGPSDPLSAEAAAHCERAYEALRERVQADQNDTKQRALLTDTAACLIALHHQAGRPDSAARAWQRHMHFREALLQLHPGMLKDDIEVLQDLCGLLRLHVCARQPDAVLAVTRQAVTALARCPDSLVRDCWHPSQNFYIEIATQLRRCGARAEALRVSEQFVQRFQRLARQEPDNLRYEAVLSHAWHWLSKAHWDLRQREETLDALRQAVAAQRRVLARQPASAHDREQLGELYLRLARKLCEMDRQDGAKQCLRERQGLWPNDAGQSRKARRDLEHWAATVADAGREPTAEQQAQRRRYLELSAWVLREAEAVHSRE
jgi:tetratricopeptide (TPR) repeat protein/predicted Ser/Thr protein kinase